MKITKKIKEDLKDAQFEYVMRCTVDKCMTDLDLESSGFDEDLELLMNDEELLPQFTICIMAMIKDLIFEPLLSKEARDNFNKNLN